MMEAKEITIEKLRELFLKDVDAYNRPKKLMTKVKFLFSILKSQESQLSKQQEEINKLLKSHSDWMTLAIERKEEIKKLKEALNILDKGTDVICKENQQLTSDNYHNSNNLEIAEQEIKKLKGILCKIRDSTMKENKQLKEEKRGENEVLKDFAVWFNTEAKDNTQSILFSRIDEYLTKTK